MFKTLSDFPVSKLKGTSREAMKLTACIWFLSCLFLKPISSVKSPCDFRTCRSLPDRLPPFSEEVAQKFARCYVGCLEFKQVNISSFVQRSSDVLSWPSAFTDITERSKLQGCATGCALLGGDKCTAGCGRIGDRLDGCSLGCTVYDQLQNDTGKGHLPNHPIGAPVAAKFSSGKIYPVIHLNLNNTQPSVPTVPVNISDPGYFNSFVIHMSYNNSNHYRYMLSTLPQDNVRTIAEFHCKTVNISFAVANRYGISDYSPSGEICGGGVVYPTAVTGLTYTLRDDVERRQYSVVKIELNWEPPPEYEYVTHYDIHVSTPRGLRNSDHCPEYTSRHFVAPKNATSILLESKMNATGHFDFKIPAQCQFEVEIISQPEKPDDADWNDVASLPERIETDYIGDKNLQMHVEHEWNWHEAGYYTLSLSVTLPNETYIPECVDHILIQVHTASIESIPGTIKIKQVLPSEKILIKTQELKYKHFLRSRYPPFASIDELEYVFTILAKPKDKCYYYRIPKAGDSELKFLAPSYAPSPAYNVTVDDFYLEGSQITITISWKAPLVTNGELWRYVIYMWHHAAPDDQQIHFVASEFTRFELTKEIFAGKQQYIMVRAENYYESANWSDPYVLTLPSHVTPPSVPSGLIYGVVAAAVVAAVILVVLIILTIICCWQKRKDKVVFLKDTENEWYVGGKGNAIDTVPVDSLPVDQWEISPDQIIMDKQLGSGNFGEVFLGKLIGAITTPGVGTYIGTRSVAVKLLKNDAGPELKVDFLKEISTMKKISLGRCPHVVNMVGCCTLQEPLALVLEYASYGDLLEYLRTMRRNYIKKSKEYEDMKANPYLSPLVNNITTLAVSNDYVEEFQTVKSMQEVSCEEEKKDDNPYASLGELEPFDLISFAYQIAMGMEYLASIPIVHRDLACRNILVDENKVLKISDFGLARTDELYVKNTDGKLPLRWMALESIVERTFSHKSDVWSYGVTLWEVCTLGGHPYPTISNKQLLQFLLQGNRLEKPHNCSDDIYNVMKRCWNADSEERPTFAELRATFDIMMSNQQTESYVDLNVDDLLPYYQMKPAEEDVDCPHTPTFPVVGPTKSLQSDHSDTVLPDNTSIDEPTF